MLTADLILSCSEVISSTFWLPKALCSNNFFLDFQQGKDFVFPLPNQPFGCRHCNGLGWKRRCGITVFSELFKGIICFPLIPQNQVSERYRLSFFTHIERRFWHSKEIILPRQKRSRKKLRHEVFLLLKCVKGRHYHDHVNYAFYFRHQICIQHL